MIPRGIRNHNPGNIDRTDPTTVEFIGALGALGLLDGPGRAGQILEGQVRDS